MLDFLQQYPTNQYLINPCLGNPVPSVGPLKGRLEPQDNVFLGNPLGHKGSGRVLVCEVLLQPDFGILDIEVDDRSIQSLRSIPTHFHPLVMTLLAIADQIMVSRVTIQIGLGIFCQKVLN
jgi:hypothetical protein